MRAPKPVGLALQGGGSWGAYTWGALDAVLRNRRLQLKQLSGTSAGAINAAIVAGALAKGSAEDARKALRSFWMSIANPAAPALVRSLWGPLGRHLRNPLSDLLVASGVVSRYASALAINGLRDVIAKHVDIDAIRSAAAPALFVTVTNVRSGLPRVISNGEMSIDALLASACLPELFPAVEIDGESYWDGGYGGNPTLWPMIHSGLADDLILVQLVPDRIEDVPSDSASIRKRVGEIVFHSSLVAEMQAIHAMRTLGDGRNTDSRLSRLRLHRIGPPRLELFDQGDGIERARHWLQLLHNEGCADGRLFVRRHGADIGVRETLDIGAYFIDSRKPKLPLAANDAFVPAADVSITQAV